MYILVPIKGDLRSSGNEHEPENLNTMADPTPPAPRRAQHDTDEEAKQFKRHWAVHGVRYRTYERRMDRNGTIHRTEINYNDCPV